MRSVIFMMNRVKKQSTQSNNTFPNFLCVCVSQMHIETSNIWQEFLCVWTSYFQFSLSHHQRQHHESLGRLFVYLHFVTFMARHNQSSWRDVRACRILLFSLVCCHKKLSDKNVQWTLSSEKSARIHQIECKLEFPWVPFHFAVVAVVVVCVSFCPA